MLKDQGKLQEAADMFQKSLAMYIKTLGEEHHSVATTYNNLAGVCCIGCMLAGHVTGMWPSAGVLCFRDSCSCEAVGDSIRLALHVEEAAEMFKKTLAGTR